MPLAEEVFTEVATRFFARQRLRVWVVGFVMSV
jgi:hypothetical protein